MIRARRSDRVAGTRQERGAVLVEFALILPFLAMLLFGMMTGGLVLNRKMAATTASREGARYGATVAPDQCTPASNCAGRTWAQQVRTATVARAEGSVTESDVCVALVEGPGSAPVPLSQAHTTMSTLAPCYVDQSADNGKRVQVVITFHDRIQAVVLNLPVTVTARTTSKLEQ